jgi:hypothetical protein
MLLHLRTGCTWKQRLEREFIGSAHNVAKHNKAFLGAGNTAHLVLLIWCVNYKLDVITELLSEDAVSGTKTGEALYKWASTTFERHEPSWTKFVIVGIDVSPNLTGPRLLKVVQATLLCVILVLNAYYSPRCYLKNCRKYESHNMHKCEHFEAHSK